MLELLRMMVIAGSLIIITFMVLLALPQCKLRDMLMPFVAWGFVVLCAALRNFPGGCPAGSRPRAFRPV